MQSSDIPIGETFFDIVESHMDLNGHMNHAKYLELYEEARWRHMTGVFGTSFEEAMSQPFAFIIFEINCRYKKEVVLGDTVQIKTRVASVNKFFLTYEQEMIVGGKVVNSLTAKQCLIDKATRKPIDYRLAAGLRKTGLEG